MPLFLSPKLQSQLLKQQNQRVHFFVWTDISHVSSIELWSNLHQHKTWHATSFTRVATPNNDGWYQLTLPLWQQPCGTYEYTLKYWQNGQEVWLGSPFENGNISIVASTHHSPPPPLDPHGRYLTLLDSHHHQQHTWSWIYTIEKRIGQHWIPLFAVNRMHSYMALARKSSCWLVPVSGSTFFEHDTRPWQLFIYRDGLDGATFAWMVKTCKNQDAWLHINTTTSVLELHMDQQQGDNMMYLVGGRTHDTSDNAIKTLVSTLLASQQQQQQQRHGEGSVGVMHDYLGYCTWNSLGQRQDDMNMTGIIKALDSFEQHHIPIGYLIMDDGWQKQQGGSYLAGFDADLHKFPTGLSGTIQVLKQRYPSLQSIGVWHTLWGDWCGVDKASIGKLYSPIRSYYSSGLETLSDHGDTNVYLILFDSGVFRFYDDFYRYLADAGVAMVKIDYQGGMGDLLWRLDANSNNTLVPLTLKDRHQLWDTYRVAAAQAMEKYFTTPPLHCMALNPHLLDCPNLETTTKIWHDGIIRNSDDFFPDAQDSHPWHIYGNLLNSIWSSSFFSVVDFDMFQSAHPFGEYHAASRAISGGPIYITDVPGKQDVKLIQTLVAENRDGWNQILRCLQPPWPLYDTVLGGKPAVDQDFIGAWNTIGVFGFVYGYWSMQRAPHQCIVTTPIPLGFVGYVSLGLDTGKWMYNLESKDDLVLAFRLNGGGCSLVRVVPAYSLYQRPSLPHVITGTVACLGLLDKLNGLQPVLQTELDSATLSQQPLSLERPDLVAHGNTRLFTTRLSHRSSQCGFLLSFTTTSATTILWAKLDGVDVKLEKKHSCSPSMPATHQAELWILDMTQVSLASSNAPYFSIEIHLSY